MGGVPGRSRILSTSLSPLPPAAPGVAGIGRHLHSAVELAAPAVRKTVGVLVGRTSDSIVARGYRKTRFSGLRKIGTPISPITRFAELGARARWTLAETGRNLTDTGYRRASLG